MSAATKPAAPRERPILFSAPLVRAILAGTKTVTRRLIRPQPDAEGKFSDETIKAAWEAGFIKVRCPFGAPGDRLWVREAWRGFAQSPAEGFAESVRVDYRADHETRMFGIAECNGIRIGAQWRPSIHMPRWASRIDLEVTAVSVERLQAITWGDALAEGIDTRSEKCLVDRCEEHAREAFAEKWDELHGAGSWGSNPWVWRIGFRRVRP